MARTVTVTNTQETSVSRPRRTPLGKRNRLDVKNKEPGFAYRIVNDNDDRIERLQEEDWELVPEAKVGAIGDRRVDNTSSLGSQSYFSVGKGVKAVVMRKREEWHKDDQTAKLQEIKELEETMRQEAKKKSDYGDLNLPR